MNTEKMKSKLCFICFVIMFLPMKAWSLPNVGVDANTLPEGILFARQRFFYVDYEAQFDEREDKYVDFEDSDKYISRWRLTEIAYGVNDDWTVVANVWYYDAQINSGIDSAEQSGIGDAYLFSKNKLFSFAHGKNTGVSLLLGARFPTGDFKDKPILRIGDGSTDIGVGISSTATTGNFNHSVVAAVWKNVDHKAGGNDADEYELRTTTEWVIAPRKFNIQLEIKGLQVEGGDEYVYEFVPGIQYTPIFPLTFQLSRKMPFSQKGYFKYDNQIVFGVSFGLPIK